MKHLTLTNPIEISWLSQIASSLVGAADRPNVILCMAADY